MLIRNFNSKFFNLLDSVEIALEAQSLENTELLMRFQTDLLSFGDWFTDDSISLLRYSFSFLSLIPSLFSPTHCLALMYDVYSSMSFQCYFSHTLAVSSLQSGALDILLHRRPLHDDEAGFILLALLLIWLLNVSILHYWNNFFLLLCCLAFTPFRRIKYRTQWWSKCSIFLSFSLSFCKFYLQREMFGGVGISNVWGCENACLSNSISIRSSDRRGFFAY